MASGELDFQFSIMHALTVANCCGSHATSSLNIEDQYYAMIRSQGPCMHHCMDNQACCFNECCSRLPITIRVLPIGGIARITPALAASYQARRWGSELMAPHLGQSEPGQWERSCLPPSTPAPLLLLPPL